MLVFGGAHMMISATDTQATATGGDSCPRTATFTGGDSFTTHRQFSISIIESPCAMDTWLLMVFDFVRLCSIVFVFGHLLIVARISHKAFLWHITVTQIACKYISPTLFCKPTDCNEKTSSQKTWTSKGVNTEVLDIEVQRVVDSLRLSADLHATWHSIWKI